MDDSKQSSSDFNNDDALKFNQNMSFGLKLISSDEDKVLRIVSQNPKTPWK